MKKYLSLICVIFLCLLSTGCDLSPIYTVGSDEEAIVTRNGNIVGNPKKPGLHFKIPIIQSIHKVRMDRINYFSLPVPNSKSLKAKIMWAVQDSKQFFKTEQKGNVFQLVRATVTPVFNKIIGEYDIDSIALISRRQNEDPKYTDDTHIRILKVVEEFLDDFGIKLVNIYFEYD